MSEEKTAGVQEITRRSLCVSFFISAILFIITSTAHAASDPAAESAARKAQRHDSAASSTADHSRYEQLKRDFKTGPEVTEACLECHVEAAKQLHKTTHWTWSYTNPITGQTLGKKNVINNFCISTGTNWPRCTSCHIGYGWKDDTFDVASDKNVDCLVCHDTTGTYQKFPPGAGHPAYEDKAFEGKTYKAVDLNLVAQNVGKPSRANCGACHFYGGGGDAVKHGDLDSTMANPDHNLDVHMAVDGLNFACTACHTTGGHEVSGSRYATKAVDRMGIDVPGHTDDSRATCESCHGMTPHPALSGGKLNDHTDVVACSTCHVPEFARGGKKTKVLWDWSTAGRVGPDGKPIKETDADGEVTYVSQKGTFEWQADVVPQYRWFDGRIDFTLPGDKIDPSGIVMVNRIHGQYGDPDSRIWPFKIMHSKQPYDKKQNILALPHLFGQDEAAFWSFFDWKTSLAKGMKAHGLTFSGEYGFVETRYHWPILHMVAPKEKALACNDCHVTGGRSRLAALTGFYMPGRDSYPWLTTLGWIAAALSLIGVLIHLTVRVAFVLRRK